MIDGRRHNGSQSSRGTAGKSRRKNPIGRAFHALGITPNQVTLVGVILAGVSAYFIGRGYLWLGIVLLTVSGLTDFVDGAIARVVGVHSVRGAFIDSVADRVVDSLLFGGVAWYLISTKHPHEAILPIAVLGAGYLVSYQRAKAESLGMSGKGGLMERAERLIVLGVSLSFDGKFMIPILWGLFVLTMVTVIQRFIKVWGQAAKLDEAESRLSQWIEMAKEKREARVQDRSEREPIFHGALERYRIERAQKTRLSRELRGDRGPKARRKFIRESERSLQGTPKVWERLRASRPGSRDQSTH